jgi:hypothetical protein
MGLGGCSTPLRTIEELIENDEDSAVEFKSTARWDVNEARYNKAMEDSVVKTVAGFLNTDGGTLLIGVGPDLKTVGLDQDYEKVKPKRRRLRQLVDHPPHQRDWQRPGVTNAGTDRCARGPGQVEAYLATRKPPDPPANPG